MPWRPGRREEQLALEMPYEDVPAHLHAPLRGWLTALLADTALVNKLAMDFRIDLPALRAQTNTLNGRAALLTRCDTDSEFFLECVHYVLGQIADHPDPSIALDRLLASSNSVYRVAPTRDGLEERVAGGVRESVQEAVHGATGSAGQHLTEAWNSAYGLSVDPVKAFSEAIKAVEAAAAPVISPENHKATLGTLIRDLSSKPEKWLFVLGGSDLDPVQMLIDQMRALWTGQTSRHGGVKETRPETLEEARAAVLLAACLVQWFTAGSVTKA